MTVQWQRLEATATPTYHDARQRALYPLNHFKFNSGRVTLYVSHVTICIGVGFLGMIGSEIPP